MHRKYLIVTESFTFGGLETQITGEITQLKKLGCDVYLAVGRNYSEEALSSGFGFALKDLPMGPDATLNDLIISSNVLTEFIRENDIDCIHCHPFTSFLPALFACLNTGIQFTYTLHGPASLDAIYGPYYEFLVQGIMFPAASLVTCVSDEVYSLALAHIPEDRLLLLPNSVDLDRIQPVQAGDPGRWLIVSRLDIYKAAGIKTLLSYVKDGLFSGIDIIGDGPASDDIRDYIKEAPELSDKVRMLGRKSNVTDYFEGYGGVAGMGRVVLEACAANIPTMLLGYDGPKGLVDVELAGRARISNFSGRGFSTVGMQDLHDQLTGLRQSPASYRMREWVAVHHNEARIWAEFAGRLESGPRAGLPIAKDLMQFFVEKAGSGQHTSPFIFDENLREDVGRFLASHYPRSFPRSIFEKIMASHRDEAKSLSYGPIAERDERISCLSQLVEKQQIEIGMLNAQVATLSRQVLDFQNSTSWKITRPMRFMKRFLQSPGNASTELAGYLFRRSPSGVQSRIVTSARRALQALRMMKWRLSGKHPLITDIARTFDVPEKFVNVFRSHGHPIDLSKASWLDLYENLPPLQKLSIEYAMSTVIRGRNMLSLLAGHSRIRHKERYLDVGTAYGGFLRAAKEIGFQEVIGIELQPQLAELAEASVEGLAGTRVITGDFIKDDFSGLGGFDLITCSDVIEHVDDPELAIQKMVSLLSDEGSLSFEVPNRDCITFVKSDGHFLIFGITQLAKQDAAEYYSALTGADQSVYFFEMGEMYELDWYLERLTENGMSAWAVDTHKIGEIEDVPHLVADLRQGYQDWQKETKPRLETGIAHKVSASVENYISSLEFDCLNLNDEISRQAFRNKYLRAFWTIMASRKTADI
jgi:2-polyprenyl-3-methyl-5-hydroxy-6-metoxy-1,4-benzoquinol methylase/glycosyltransferase involved in cell wall biosynthesis